MVWLKEEIASKKILVVGAGGIGCELLKNLILAGFSDLTVIDLDTIDVSNLNRQFLFQKQHVGKSKSLIAKESVLKLTHAGRDVSIDARMCSIFLPEFSVPWIKQFSIILNALDNVSARNHVNRLALAADIPLVESGTAGYSGESSVIKKGLSPCYECSERPRNKTYPGCTIRNTPSEPIHCIVWAKFLFSQLFGEPDDEQEVSPDAADPELANGEAAENKGNIKRINTTVWAEENDWDPKILFNKFFKEDINSLLSMSKLWEKEGRKKPSALDYDEIIGCGDGHATGSKMELRTLKENVAAWHKAVTDAKTRRKRDGHLSWDKDDTDAMMFVAAAANIRCGIFKIEQKTEWKVKEMAGNIIPAIATANAVIAAIVCLQAVKILKNNIKKTKEVSLRVQPASHYILAASTFAERNPTCVVCAEKPTVTIMLDTKKFTLKDLREKICQKKLSMNEPDVEKDGNIILSSDEDDLDEVLLAKTLSEVGVGHGTILTAEDFQQEFKLTIHVEHVEELPEVDGQNELEFRISGQEKAEATISSQAEEVSVGKKRALSEKIGNEPAAKVQKINLDEDEIICTDDIIC